MFIDKIQLREAQAPLDVTAGCGDRATPATAAPGKERNISSDIDWEVLSIRKGHTILYSGY